MLQTFSQNGSSQKIKSDFLFFLSGLLRLQAQTSVFRTITVQASSAEVHKMLCVEFHLLIIFLNFKWMSLALCCKANQPLTAACENNERMLWWSL